MGVIVRKSLGTQPVYGVRESSGTAYVVIPEDQDRDEYIKHSYLTGTLMLRNELGSTWTNVFATRTVLRDVKFPDRSTERGSIIVWVRIPKHNVILATAVVDPKNEIGLIQEEEQLRLQKKFGGNLVDFDMRAQRSSIDLSVTSTQNGSGALRFNITNPDKTAKFNTYVRGSVDSFADNKQRIGSNNEILLDILDDSGENLGKLNYVRDQGWTTKDQYDNYVELRDGSISLKVGEGKQIWITEQEINLSKENAQYKAVLGEKLKQKLEQFLDGVSAITVPTAMGPSGTPINMATFTQIRAELNEILSQIVKLD